MTLEVMPDAALWFKKEFGFTNGGNIRIYPKIYGGIPTIFPNYYLGIKSQPVTEDGVVVETAVGVSFQILENDTWILNDFNLRLELENNDIKYHFIPHEGVSLDAVSGASAH